jgi:hypothetical protein
MMNYTWYTVTLATNSLWLTDTILVMPTDHLPHLPLVINAD